LIAMLHVGLNESCQHILGIL